MASLRKSLRILAFFLTTALLALVAILLLVSNNGVSKLDSTPVETPVTYGVLSLAFSPNGKTLVIGTWDGKAFEFDVALRRCVRARTLHSAGVYGLAFSPDGKSIASAGYDATIAIWDATIQTQRAILGRKRNSGFVSIAFSPDGKSLVSRVGGGSRYVIVWDLETKEERLEIVGRDSVTGAVSVSPADGIVATGGKEGTIETWSAQTGVKLGSLERPSSTTESHTAYVTCLAFSNDGRYVASGGAEKTVKICEITNGKIGKIGCTLEVLPYSVADVCFSPDGRLVAACCTIGEKQGGESARVWDRESGKVVAVISAPWSGINRLAFSPDGKLLATSNRQTGVIFHDVSTLLKAGKN